MIQLELPLVYPSTLVRVFPKKYQLPLRWKAIFVLLLIYGVALSTITYVKATQTPRETAPVPREFVQAPAETAQVQAGAARVKMTATVAGWYDVTEINNANLHIMTNMKVWVNGREFIRCDDCGQRTTTPSLLDY